METIRYNNLTRHQQIVKQATTNKCKYLPVAIIVAFGVAVLIAFLKKYRSDLEKSVPGENDEDTVSPNHDGKN